MIGAIIGDIAGSGTGSFTANTVMFLATGKALMECDHRYETLVDKVKEYSETLMDAVYHEKAKDMPFSYIPCFLPVAYFARSYMELRQLVFTIINAFPDATLEDAYAAELETAEVFRYLRFLSVKSFKKAFLPKRFTFRKETGEYLSEIDQAFNWSKSFAEAITNAKETSDSCNLATVVGALAEPFHGVPVSFRDRALEVLGPELADLFVRIEESVHVGVPTYVPDDAKPSANYYQAGRFFPSRWEYLKRRLGKPKDYYMKGPVTSSRDSRCLDLTKLGKQEESND